MRRIALILALLCFIVPADAKKKKKKKGNRGPSKEEVQRQKDRAERDKRRAAVNKLLDEKDTNNDGSLTNDEYLQGESDKAAAGRRFDEANKNGDRYLTKSEIEVLLGLRD